MPGRLALLGACWQLRLSASKASGKSSLSSKAIPAPQLPRQLHPWARKVVLAVAGHDGMDLIDETDVWVTLNIADVDIAKKAERLNRDEKCKVLVLVVNSSRCGVEVRARLWFM